MADKAWLDMAILLLVSRHEASSDSQLMLGICIWYVMSLASKSVSGEAAVPLCRYAAIGDVFGVSATLDTTLPLQHAEMASLQCVHFCRPQSPYISHFTRSQVPQMGQGLSSQANADEFSRKFAGQKQDRLQYKPRPDFKGGRYYLGPLLAVIRCAAYPWLMA
ncbi:hypothetical protein M431DRAFT_541592 [Trichoderma harzianum CBS 226.95]|uniref:Uncharacterized protein n=1 Tax=Trichoderma harzianum CBS 226.95 TaxID=983964 RepID=A0A2T4A0M4_TRIHA|nr:hypothetical protein M431DRAFT_541592 [Trichoderma harzianum CBS 226.95]PTB50609.1 hypothetical protein M431DRAFT_541592 [Trichoderma harzianum CBS 226.95]